MKILALDTAMAACSVAVADTCAEEPLAADFVPMERGHAESLAPMVQRVMAQSGLTFGDLDRIAVTTGPGTFTGVRIGLAMARGLGLARRLPVIGIDTLSVIAANDSGMILVAADARKDEAYTALINGGRLIRPPSVTALAQAASDILPGTKLIGTAAKLVLAASGRSDLLLSPAGDLPVATRLAKLAAQQPLPDQMPAPLYLRAPDAKPQTMALRKAVAEFIAAPPSSAVRLAEMHGESFEVPWTAQAFADLLAMPGASAVIAAEHGEPLGFVLTRCASDEAEIITIATRPFAQRRGVARALLTHRFAELIALGIRHVFIEVAHSNVAARGLYASLGFAEAGIRRGYYERGHGRREDAVVMRKELQR